VEEDLANFPTLFVVLRICRVSRGSAENAPCISAVELPQFSLVQRESRQPFEKMLGEAVAPPSATIISRAHSQQTWCWRQLDLADRHVEEWIGLPLLDGHRRG
jgi:hypothetical protein